MLLMRLLDLDVGGSVLLSLMLVVTYLGFVVVGTLPPLTFIVFFVAISRAVVNHDGHNGAAPDPLVWSAGALHKRCRLVHAVRDRAFLPGPPGIWCSEWFQVPAAVVCAEDIALRPYTPGLLVKWVSFLNSLHWPIGDLLFLLVQALIFGTPVALLFGPKPIRTISFFLELISRFEFEFRRRENFFLNDSNFWCVQSSITHTIWPYMCLCCGLFVPTEFQFECCGVLDD